MVTTMKVTLLAFNLHDGSAHCKLDLAAKPHLRRLAIRKMPSLLEFLGYIFNFQTVFTGPMIDFRTYQDFIEQEPSSVPMPIKPGSARGSRKLVAPCPTSAVLSKMATFGITIFCVVFLLPRFPLSFLRGDLYQSWPWPKRWGYALLMCPIVRTKYYAAWVMADMICNASGLGFSGLTADGRQRWDGVSNVIISKVEWGENIREVMESWNVGTHRWLLLVAYERLRWLRMPAVYALSALWHGFNPAYYLTFSMCALCTQAARMARRCLRSRLMCRPSVRPWYDLAGRLATLAAIGCMEVMFVLQDVAASVTLFGDAMLLFVLVCLAMILVLPKLLPPPPKFAPAESTSKTTAE